MSFSVLIPAYQPDLTLVNLVEKLLSLDVPQIIVVNDGSSGNSLSVFQTLRQLPRVVVLDHAVNLGKGQALKTGFNYFLLNAPLTVTGIVTADADGQHLAEDIVKVGSQKGTELVLGCREFTKDIPLRSYIGNIITRHVFQFFVGRKISDTQTGLRLIPRDLMKKCMRITATGYEFELQMLIEAAQGGIPIREVLITTVYENNNKGSHFNPFFDSLKIYFVFLRFCFVAIATALIDYLIFGLVYSISSSVAWSIVTGRVFAGSFNFLSAKGWAFRSKQPIPRALPKYLALVLVLTTCTYYMTIALNGFFGVHVMGAKAISELLLFIVSFTVQRLFIFPVSAKVNGVSGEGSSSCMKMGNVISEHE